MISVSNLSKAYGRLGSRSQALDGVSLQVSRGETLGLIGPNGAGKTTLLSCLLGFLRPDAGVVSIDGLAPDDLSIRSRTGYMPERLGFDRELSGKAFLAHHWRLAGGDPTRAAAQVRAAAARVGLEPEALNRRLGTYSRGMLQRVGMAQATLGDPSLLFLDEPASGTDPLGVAIVRERILDAKKHGATIVLNSHQLPEVEKVCDRVVFIDRGRLTHEETLRGESASPRRAVLRTREDGAVLAAQILSEAGFEVQADSGGALRLAAARDEDIARAIKVLSSADLPVFEARTFTDLEELFQRRRSPS